MVSPIRLRIRPRASAARKTAGKRLLIGPTLSRLRPRDRALADALDQLRSGVPLNWNQVEDDPELATLSALQAAAWLGRAHEGSRAPSELQAALLEQLSAQLPEYKPEPVKEPPKALAGFSEKVTVLTQVEEDIPPLTGAGMLWVRMAVALALVTLLVGWGLNTFAGKATRNSMAFSWIEAHQNNKTISTTHRPAGWKPLQCSAFNQAAPSAKRDFISISDKNQFEATVGPQAEFLPTRLTVPTTYTLELLDGAVSPCADSVPDPLDAGAIVRLSYTLRRQVGRTSADFSPLTVFEARQQPTVIDVSTGSWEEVSVGDAHGVYWRGGPYQDMEGTNWIGDLSVLVIERGDSVVTFIGQQNRGATKEMLLNLVNEMARARKGETGECYPQIHLGRTG